jgi:Na+-driven multidrug efflux pump
VGQSLGQQDPKTAEAYGWTSTKLCSFIMAVVSVFLFLFPEMLIRIFTDSPKVIVLGVLSMRFLVIEQFCNCVSIVVSGALSGAGDTKPAMRYTILSQWMLMIPLAFFLSYFTPYDLVGAWIAWAIAPIVQMGLTLKRFYFGKWKTINAAGYAHLPEE